MALLVGANRQRCFLKIRNTSSTAKVYIGQTSSVSSTTGHVVKPGSEISIASYVGPVYYSPDDFDAISYSEFNANEMGTSVGWYDSTAYFIIDAISNRAMVRLTSGVSTGTPEELIAGGYLTYSRSDSVSYRESAAGVWSSVATGTLRRKYDGSIYIEPSTTNVVPSGTINSATYWATPTQASVTSVAAFGPHGGAAYLLTENTGGSVPHFVSSNSFAITANKTWTTSVFIRPNGRSIGAVITRNGAGTNGWAAEYNLTAGTVVQRLLYGTGTFISGSVTEYPNGWYRVVTTGTIDASATFCIITLQLEAVAGDFIYTGDGASGAYFCIPQVELGTVATTPILTSSAPATRAADAFALPTSNLSISTDGTLVAEFKSAYSLNAAGAAITNVIAFDTSGSDQLAIHARHTSGKGPRLSIASTGVSPSTGPAAEAVARAAARYKSSAADAALSVNGAAAVTSATAAFLSTPTTIGLGQAESGGGSQITGTIRYLAGLSKVMSDAELAVESARYA